MAGRDAPRVLVVDDEAPICTSICGFLQRRGCVVETAADGAEALERLAQERFDVVISDLQMPVLDGEALWRRAVARDPALRHRFLFCTGSPLPASLAAEPGIRVLAKPFELSELWAALTDLLGEAG